MPLPSATFLHLLVDPGEDGSVFFTRWQPNSAIYRLRKTARNLPVSIGAPADGGWAGGLAKNADAVFYSNYRNDDSNPVRGVHRIPRNGDPSTQLVSDDAAQTYLGTVLLATEQDDLYFSTQYGSIALARTASTGGKVTPLWDLENPAPNGEGGYGLAVEDGWAYVGSGVAGVLRFSREGEKEILFDELEAGVGITFVHDVEGGLVYWESSDEILRRGNVDGSGEVELLAANVGRQATVHDGWLYLITADQKAIDRVPVDDPEAEAERLVFAPELGQIANIAFDEVSLYWMGIFRGEVFRLAL